MQVFLLEFVSKEGQNSNIVAAIFDSTQQPGRISVTSFRPRDFVHMASEEPFNYHSGLWLLLSHIILTQTCSKLRNDSIEDSEVDNRLEKIDFADLVKDAKSAAGFSPSRQFRVGRNDVPQTRPGCQDSFKMAASEVASFEINFFRIAGTSEAEISVSVKAECLLAIGEDKKIKLFGVTFSFKKSVNTASTCCVPNLQTSTFAMT